MFSFRPASPDTTSRLLNKALTSGIPPSYWHGLHLIAALRIDDVKYFPVLTYRTSSFEPIFFEKDTHEYISDGGLSLFDN